MLVDEGHRPDARIVYNIRNNWRAGILPGCSVDAKTRAYSVSFDSDGKDTIYVLLLHNSSLTM